MNSHRKSAAGFAVTLPVVVLLFVVLPSGCRKEGAKEEAKGQVTEPVKKEPAAGPTASPILLVAVDGMEWDVVLPLLAEKKLPTLAKLMKRGQYGLLLSFRPTKSPVIWTSAATGKRPEKHGILSFAYATKYQPHKLFTSENRTTKAIWNILSDYHCRVCSIGWWMTYPVEQINGVMVAQTNTLDQIDTQGGKNIWKGRLVEGLPDQVHPPRRQNEITEILEDMERNLSALTAEIFAQFGSPLSPLGQRLWNNCRWAFRADATYLRIAEKLLEEETFDLTLVYLGGPDVVGHRFWRYMQPELYAHKPSAEQIENFGHLIEDYYVYTDRAIGRLLAACPPEVTVMIASDHGMGPVNQTAEFDPDDPPSDVNSAHHLDAPPGLCIVAGPYIRKFAKRVSPEKLQRRDLTSVGSVLDITPTLLTMLRIPIGEDMDGRVMKRLFTGDFDASSLPAAVATHDDPDYLASRPKTAAAHPAQQERLRQLRSLGYIKGDDE